jgi:hypothetical protein
MAWPKKKVEPKPVTIIDDEVAEEEPSAVPVLDKYEEEIAKKKAELAEIEAEKKKFQQPEAEEKITVITESQAILYKLTAIEATVNKILKSCLD